MRAEYIAQSPSCEIKVVGEVDITHIAEGLDVAITLFVGDKNRPHLAMGQHVHGTCAGLIRHLSREQLLASTLTIPAVGCIDMGDAVGVLFTARYVYLVPRPGKRTREIADILIAARSGEFPSVKYGYTHG